MSQGRLQRTTQHFRQRLIQHEHEAEQVLESAFRSTLASIQPALERLYDQMVEKMASGEQIPLSWLYEAQRLETIKRLVDQQISHFATLSKMQSAQLQEVVARLGQQAALAQLYVTVPHGVQWSFGIPSPKALAELVGATQNGSPLADLFAGFGREAAQKVAQVLLTGVTLGNNPRQVARDVQDALGVSRARALTISRTECIRAYRSANLATLQENADVCDGWVWTCALLPRSCAVCVAMHGTEHSLSESMDSHPCCMCVMAPKTKAWSDILEPLGIDTGDIPDTSPTFQDGSDWFAKQSAATQQAIIGSKSGYELYASGKVNLKDFVRWNHDKDWGRSIQQRSVKELVKR